MNDYNGWTNRETWLVNLWMHETPSEVRHFTEQAKTLVLSELAECIEDYYSEVLPEMPEVYADLLAVAWANVNWRELAQQLAEDASYENERAASTAWTEEQAKEFGDFRSNEEVAIAYPRKTMWTEAEGSK